MERVLMTVKETSEYLNLGLTSTRQLIRRPNCTFAFRVGSKWLIDKKKLDHWIDSQCRGY